MVSGQPQSSHGDSRAVSRQEAPSAPARAGLAGLPLPLIQAVTCGLIARLLTAWLGPGFHARDDYFHVLAPALAWIDDPTFRWEESALPGAGLRSHLFPRLIQGGIALCQTLGVTDPEHVLSMLHAGLGLYSALLIPAMWLLCRNLGCHQQTTNLATWLAALHFAMPYVGTRLLIESMAMPPLLVGLAFCAKQSTRGLLVGGFWIGLSTWFRYQVGIAALGLAVGLFWFHTRRSGLKDGVSSLVPLAIGGAGALILQGSFDLATTGEFLGPVIHNIRFNLNPPGTMSHSHPLSYLGFWLALTLPPATLVVLPAMGLTAKRLWLVSWPLLTFVGIHSLIGHKEERFMIPMLPLFLVLLAAVPQEVANTSGKLGTWLTRWWPASRTYLLVTHTLALCVIITSQSQENLRHTMRELRMDEELSHLVSVGPEIQDYFLDTKRPLHTHETRHFDALWIRKTLDTITPSSPHQIHFIAFAPDRAKMQIILMAEGLRCSMPQTFEGWWLDRLAQRLNPKHNRRRSPVDLWRCRVPAVAHAPQSSPRRVALVSKSRPNLSATESARR